MRFTVSDNAFFIWVHEATQKVIAQAPIRIFQAAMTERHFIRFEGFLKELVQEGNCKLAHSINNFLRIHSNYG